MTDTNAPFDTHVHASRLARRAAEVAESALATIAKGTGSADVVDGLIQRIAEVERENEYVERRVRAYPV